MAAPRNKALMSKRGAKKALLKRPASQRKGCTAEKYCLKRPAAQTRGSDSKSSKQESFPSGLEESCAMGFVKNWNNVERRSRWGCGDSESEQDDLALLSGDSDTDVARKDLLSVTLPAVHDVQNEGGGLAVTIGLVKQGQLTLPGELLAYIVANGGILRRGEHCPGNADNGRYRARLLATDVVRRGSARGELTLDASSFRPWMLGLPSTFASLSGDSVRRVLMTRKSRWSSGSETERVQCCVHKLRTAEMGEQAKVPNMVLTLSVGRDEDRRMLQCCLTKLSGTDSSHIRVSVGMPLGELRATVARQLDHPCHKLELVPAGEIASDNPLSRSNDAKALAGLFF